ncbi:MAG: hypothetical protein ABIX28_05605 [Vicinamibacterales bacterium]
MVRTTRAAVVFCLAVFLTPALAFGQAARLGPTFSLGGTTSPVDAPDVAHDPVHNQYLQVAGKVFIEAHLVNSSGALVTGFRVNTTGEYAQTPRVAFSPDIAGGGGYLVTWHSTLGPFTRVRGRIFRYDGLALTGDFDIATSAVSGGSSSNWTMGAALAYATGSREFLVAWMGNYTTTNDVFYQRVSPAGALIGGNTLVSPGTPDWDRDPSVAYNPNTDEFLVAFASYTEAGRYGYIGTRRVKAGNGGMAAQINYGAAVSTYVPSVSFNNGTGQFLLAWYNRSAGGAAVYGANLDAAGNLVGGIRVLSPFYAAYDALDVDYNPASGQSLLVTHGGGSATWEDAAVTILANGTPYDNGFILTNTTDVRPLRGNPANSDGNFNPRVAASTNEKKWLMVTSSVFAATHAQFAGSGATGGPVVTTPVSRPLMALDVPTANATVQTSFAINGWALDAGSPSGTGVDAVHVWAFPTSGASPIFLGAASLGVARPDVGAYIGDGRFSPSGFGLSATLSPGVYDIRAYAFSTLAGGFNNSAATRITVTQPTSLPRMYVDSPAQHQTITQNIGISGWAIDQASASGVGIEAIHAWAYPTAGGAPIFVGASGVGYMRQDIANYFGAARFGPSGFYVTGTLPPGDYNLVVFAFSSLTRTFNQAMTVHVRVV